MTVSPPFTLTALPGILNKVNQKPMVDPHDQNRQTRPLRCARGRNCRPSHHFTATVNQRDVPAINCSTIYLLNDLYLPDSPLQPSK